MVTNVDLRFQNALADHLPASLSTRPAARALRRRRGPARRPARQAALRRRRATPAAARRQAAGPRRRARLHRQRALVQHPRRPAADARRACAAASCSSTSGPTRASTACARCPTSRRWDARYRADGLTIVGVHTPEFAFEHDAGNVARRDRAQQGIRYPVAQDNDYGTWNAYGNQYWPAKYLIDATGHVRYAHFGEGDYDKTEAAIRTLLAEAGETQLGAARGRGGATTPSGADHARDLPRHARARRASAGRRRPARTTTRRRRRPAAERVRLGGRWTIDARRPTAVRGATIDARVRRQGSTSCSLARRARRVQALDGRASTARRRRARRRSCAASASTARLAAARRASTR